MRLPILATVYLYTLPFTVAHRCSFLCPLNPVFPHFIAPTAPHFRRFFYRCSYFYSVTMYIAPFCFLGIWQGNSAHFCLPHIPLGYVMQFADIPAHIPVYVSITTHLCPNYLRNSSFTHSLIPLQVPIYRAFVIFSQSHLMSSPV